MLAVTAYEGFKIHNTSSEEMMYKVKNPCTTDDRSVFFLSDPPHLINCEELLSKQEAQSLGEFFCGDYPVCFV